MDLAAHYMGSRGIPLDNRVELDLLLIDTISHEVYEQDVLKLVREALMQKGVGYRIKVLVSIFGMPLRVQGPRLREEENDWIDDARGWMRSALSLLHAQEESIVQPKRGLSPSPQPSGSSIIPVMDTAKNVTISQIRTWRTRLLALLYELQQDMVRKSDVVEKNRLFTSREKSLRRVFGKIALTNESGHRSGYSLKPQGEDVAIQQILANLMLDPTSKKLTQAYALVQEAYGLWGILAFAQWEIERYQQADASASLDSELSFLWWEAGTYPLGGRLPNPFYLGYGVKVG
jgi:hypothetical protein